MAFGFHFQPLRDVGAGDDPRRAALAASQFRRGQRIVLPPMLPELRKLDSRSSAFPRSPRRCCLRSRLAGVVLLGMEPLDDFGHEEQLLVGRRSIAFATLAEHHSPQQPQLLRGLRQLLLVHGGHLLLLGDDRLLLGDDRLLLGDRLFQLTNPLLALGKALDKIRTSVFHALWNPRYDSWFRNHPKIPFRPTTRARRRPSRSSPSRATPHAGQVDAFEDQCQIAQVHLDPSGRCCTILP